MNECMRSSPARVLQIKCSCVESLVQNRDAAGSEWGESVAPSLTQFPCFRCQLLIELSDFLLLSAPPIRLRDNDLALFLIIYLPDAHTDIFASYSLFIALNLSIMLFKIYPFHSVLSKYSISCVIKITIIKEFNSVFNSSHFAKCIVIAIYRNLYTVYV